MSFTRNNRWFIVMLTVFVSFTIFKTTIHLARAEGSRELMNYEASQGGNVRYGFNMQDLLSWSHPTWTAFNVYLQVGETLHLGSNQIHSGLGNIYVWSPGTEVFTGTYPSTAVFSNAIVNCVNQSAGDTTIGLIDTRTKEQTGPERTPGDGGYRSCQYTASTSGIYPIIFTAVTTSGNPSNMVLSNEAIPAQNENAVHAWDATVRNASGVDQSGRLFSNSFTFIETGPDDPDQQFYIYSRDGHQYRLRLDEMDGFGWTFFINNKGIQNRATGEPTYKSWSAFSVDELSDPQFIHPAYELDTVEDVTYKIFINPPDPVVITGPGGLAETLGYASAPVALPVSTAFQFDGSASGGGIGYAPDGFTNSAFSFDSAPGLDGTRYFLIIDANRNGSINDAADRRLSGIFNSAGNNVPFDGRDGNNILLVGNNTYTVTLFGVGGEIHFPMFDVENLVGLQIDRLTNINAGDVNTVHYDDFNGTALTNASPVSLPGGGDSTATGFRGYSLSTGDRDALDTWMYTNATLPMIITFDVVPSLIDYGNLGIAYGDATHSLSSVYLGSNVDADTGPGNDVNDGISRNMANFWQPSNTVGLSATVNGGNGYLAAWADWNGDGVFNNAAPELVISQAVINGDNVLNISVPVGAGYSTGDPLNIRFRLYDINPGTPVPTGAVVGGEVEDYSWVFGPTALTLNQNNAAVTMLELRTILPIILLILSLASFVIIRKTIGEPQWPK